MRSRSVPRSGDWDKLKLIASEDPDNLLEHTVFRHGTQILHGHLSQFAAEENYWGADDPADRIHDRKDAPTVGTAVWRSPVAEPSHALRQE